MSFTYVNVIHIRSSVLVNSLMLVVLLSNEMRGKLHNFFVGFL